MKVNAHEHYDHCLMEYQFKAVKLLKASGQWVLKHSASDILSCQLRQGALDSLFLIEKVNPAMHGPSTNQFINAHFSIRSS